MAEHYKHGSMDISEQKRTFENFIKIVTWAVVAIIVTLVFLAVVNA